MSLAAAEMQQLQRAVDSLDAGNPHHARFFREALAAARRRGEPLEALELLASLRDSPYAVRESEQQALGAALQWTAQRLRQDPGLAAPRFCAEVGWLLRLLRLRAVPPSFRDAAASRGRPERGRDRERERGPREGDPAAREAGRGRGPGPGQPGAPAGGRGPGGPRGGAPSGRGAGPRRPAGAPAQPAPMPVDRLIAQLADARQRAQASARPPGASAAAGTGPARAGAPAASPAPIALPERFPAEFTSVQEAREVRRAARKRAREGRPAKETRIAVRAVDAGLRAVRIAASSTRTAGLEQVFDAMEARAGQTVRFTVSAVERQPDGTQLATQVSLEVAAADQ